MPIDPSIISRLQAPQIQTQDPLERYAKILGIQGGIGQQQMQNLQLDEARRSADVNERVRALYASNPKATSDQVMGIDPKTGMAVRKAELEAAGHQSTIDKNKAEIVTKAVAQHRDELANVNDPQTAAQWVAAGYQHPVLGELAKGSGVSLEQALSRIPQDPQAFQQWKQQNALGATKFIEQNKPHITTQNTGGASNIVATPGLGGAPTVLSSTPMTLTPGEVQTGAHQKVTESIAKGHLGIAGAAQRETTRHNAAVEARAGEAASRERMSQPFEVTGADGKQILVQQDKNTGVLLDVNTKQPVAGVAPKLDTATEGKLRDVRTTSATLDQLIKNFNPSYVGIKGMAGEFQDKYLTQIPGMEKTVGNPDRVTFRQLSASVVNNYINQITGATVGQGGEQQRLMRAVPTPEDSPVQFKAKMEEMRRNLDELPSIIANNPNVRGAGGAGAPTAAPAATTTPAPPKLGERRRGYIYKGGDPADPKSWEK